MLKKALQHGEHAGHFTKKQTDKFPLLPSSSKLGDKAFPPACFRPP